MAIMEGKRGCQSIVKIHVYRVYQTAFFIQQNITYITVYIKLNGFEKMHFFMDPSYFVLDVDCQNKKRRRLVNNYKF